MAGNLACSVYHSASTIYNPLCFVFIFSRLVCLNPDDHFLLILETVGRWYFHLTSKYRSITLVKWISSTIGGKAYIMLRLNFDKLLKYSIEKCKGVGTLSIAGPLIVTCSARVARCVVHRVDEETGRVVVSLNRSIVPPSPALYLRSLLSETFASAAASTAKASDQRNGDADAAADAEVRPWGSLEFGGTVNGVVVALKEYGVVLKAVPVTGKKGRRGDKGGQLMVCPLEHAMEGLEEGNEVKVRILCYLDVYFFGGGGVLVELCCRWPCICCLGRWGSGWKGFARSRQG